MNVTHTVTHSVTLSHTVWVGDCDSVSVTVTLTDTGIDTDWGRPLTGLLPGSESVSARLTESD